MSVYYDDVETDCAMEGPPEESSSRNKKHLQFDPKFRHLPGGGMTDGRFDSHDSGIDSFRSVDSAVCLSTDSGRAESFLTSISEHVQPLTKRLENIAISSSERRVCDEIRTDQKNVEDEEDEAFVDSCTSSGIDESLAAAQPIQTADIEGETAPRGSWTHLTDDAFDQDQEGDTPLHLAIIHSKEEIALRFIYCTIDPELLNIKNDLAQTPLHLSVLTRQPGICRALVLAGAQVDSIDRNGDTPLHVACKLSDDDCIRALTERVSPLEIQQGMVRQSHILNSHSVLQDLELKNFEGFTCIHILGFLSNVEHLQYLVNLGANINAPDGKSGRTALHYSVEMDNPELTKHLIQTLGADVDAMTFDLCTPLHLAVGRGLRSIVELLILNKADTDIANFEGDRPCDLSGDSQICNWMYFQNVTDEDDKKYSDIRIQGQ